MLRDRNLISSPNVRCNPGDVVLLCFDENHQNYVVFLLGPSLHFLHTDCLDVLGLKTAPGTVRKGWVLAEVIDKEFCQARKPQNRYHVAFGTRFYRVKAKPWDKEAAVRRVQQRRTPPRPSLPLPRRRVPLLENPALPPRAPNSHEDRQPAPPSLSEERLSPARLAFPVAPNSQRSP
ncbi:hypothetical protein HPB48_005992 [Haemaphysalis longicornis]|uniref:Autophagy-related protein 11 C-terminal domain-containing protein n=1 Tax=Haemaphysalis longicornis TaxID=44386 RepID=A0A9J6FKY8_HAELO|nr:hypothetical protein HPB48_005992 [Haemaphysalis longicornis]